MSSPASACRYRNLIAERLPHLPVGQARLLPSTGQFNTVLCIDDKWIFRFPKSPQAAADLARELEILPRLRGMLPLPIPDPRYKAWQADTGELLFMGYALLPGEPLLREKFAALRHDDGIVERIAHDLALFLLALHAIAPADIGLEPSGNDARPGWARIYADLREKLYPHMRADARRELSRNFERALNDAGLWQFDDCLIHGDFGTGNILYQDGRVSGVIDFGFCGLGDPAQELGALIASYGEPFVEKVFEHYPALRDGLARARFYRSNYALIQALYALRDGDEDAFKDGISAYR